MNLSGIRDRGSGIHPHHVIDGLLSGELVCLLILLNPAMLRSVFADHTDFNRLVRSMIFATEQLLIKGQCMTNKFVEEAPYHPGY